MPVVQLDSKQAPAVNITNGTLQIVESGALGDRAISTSQSFDWTPAKKDSWIQVRFDLIKGAPYVGYLIALGGYNDIKDKHKGNILFDGAESGQAKIYLDYPGPDGTQPGAIGESGYKPGKNYGVRITNIGDGNFQVAQLVNGLPENNTVNLKKKDLPPGGFGFALCCGRSYVVDNVRVESSVDPTEMTKAQMETSGLRKSKSGEFTKQINALQKRKPADPPMLAPVLDLSPKIPTVHILERGVHKNRGDKVDPAPPAVLMDSVNNKAWENKPDDLVLSTGNRLGFARWITRPDTRASALLARVTVNRWWQNHFGRGIVATPDNLGYSGSPPSHPELLEYLATELIRSGWSQKAIHRMVLCSNAFRQTSNPTMDALNGDEDNTLLSRFPLKRLDAEALRDAMLFTSGELNMAQGGPYTPTTRGGDGEVIVPETHPGAKRRSLYLQQRRTQTTGILELFDAPSIVYNCTIRMPTTVPLQSLIMLNSPFARMRSEAFAKRVLKEVPGENHAKLTQAFQLAWGRPPTEAEESAANTFLITQESEYKGIPNSVECAWIDLANMLLAANAFLYVE
jgi:hypothetical protein